MWSSDYLQLKERKRQRRANESIRKQIKAERLDSLSAQPSAEVERSAKSRKGDVLQLIRLFDGVEWIVAGEGYFGGACFMRRYFSKAQAEADFEISSMRLNDKPGKAGRYSFV